MEFWALLALFFLLVVPVVAFVALARTSRMRGELDSLRRQVLGLQAALDQTRRAAPAPRQEPMPEAQPPPAPPEPPSVEAEPVPAPAAAGSVPHSPLRPRARQAAALARADLEERFASRWLVWAGGATIALGGGFLVKYSIDNELLGPLARILLGLLLSLALIAAGEWLRRQPPQKALAAIEPSYVPPALTAAGLATGFASVYAAYALYGLLTPLAAFAALAGFSAAGVALSLYHGPFIAALGFAGGVAALLLVSTGAPQVTLLFPYLFLVLAGTVGVQRFRPPGSSTPACCSRSRSAIASPRSATPRSRWSC